MLHRSLRTHAPSPPLPPSRRSRRHGSFLWRRTVPRAQLVWETWIEQLSLYPASGTVGASQATARKRLHGSPLAHARTAKLRGALPQLSPATECNAMNAPPSNVVKGATVCEEVHVNPSAQTFITSNG